VIYYCADDYGLCDAASERIKKCIDDGILNKVSVFPNINDGLEDLIKYKGIRISLHLNLVEGKCMADPTEINLLVNQDGNFIHTFGGLLKLSILKRKEFEKQVYKELKAQVVYWQNAINGCIPFCVDSHQHTHMIPEVFKTLIKILKEEKILPEYIRIPAEPILPFIKHPELYLSYSLINCVKQFTLRFFWLINKKYAINLKIPVSYFFGILFSGEMDERRIRKILPEYIKISRKRNADIEVLFHPGYTEKHEVNFKEKNLVFEKFYISENRKTEFNSVMKLKESGEF